MSTPSPVAGVSPVISSNDVISAEDFIEMTAIFCFSVIVSHPPVDFIGE